MKVIVQHSVNPNIYKIVASLRTIGVDCFIWDKRVKPLFDLLVETDASVLICAANMTTDITDAVHEFRLKTIVVDTINNINNTRLRVRPDAYCITDGKACISGAEVIYLDSCADLISLKDGQRDENYKTDALYLSDNAGVSVDQMVKLNMLCYPNSDLKFKIIGPISVNLLAYAGNPEPKTTLSFLKSSDIVIDLGGLHILDYVANGIFCISDTENPCVPYYNKGEDLLNLVKMFLSNKGKKKKVLDKAKSYIIQNKLTSFHIAADLCKALGEYGYQKQLLECIV
jgi:hypothetical protein